MLGKDLSEAMTGIADEKVQSAMEAHPRRGRGRNIWIRVAAMAATLAILLTAALWPRENENGIVTAPGILKAYAYEMKGSDKIDITEMEGMELVDDSIPSYMAIYCPFMSVARGVVITPVVAEESLKDAEITYEVTANYGELYGDFYSEKYTGGNKIQATREEAFLGKQASIKNWETIYWEGKELLGEDSVALTEKVYVDMIIKADGNIVGYGIFEMDPWVEDGMVVGLTGHLKHTVFYPLVDGEYQEITADYVGQQIAEYKAS